MFCNIWPQIYLPPSDIWRPPGICSWSHRLHNTHLASRWYHSVPSHWVSSICRWYPALHRLQQSLSHIQQQALQKLEACIPNICHWRPLTGLKVNDPKSKFLLFHSKNTPPPSLSSLAMQPFPLPVCQKPGCQLWWYPIPSTPYLCHLQICILPPP